MTSGHPTLRAAAPARGSAGRMVRTGGFVLWRAHPQESTEATAGPTMQGMSAPPGTVTDGTPDAIASQPCRVGR